MAMQPGSMTLNQINRNGIYVEIVEQPKSLGTRFRYKCEGRSAGSIPGERSTDSNRSFPAIRICNYTGPKAVVVVSLVNTDNPPRPHPHRLVGANCSEGVCTVKVNCTPNGIITFPQLGIQCVKRQDIGESLLKRKELKIDPFLTETKAKTDNNFDMSTVRLCFQVFLPDDQNKFSKIVAPVVSNSIIDKKVASDLAIHRLSRTAGSVLGGDEIFILCDKVTKDNIGVRFFEEAADGTVIWESSGMFGASDIHKQVAIVLRTPAYRDTFITKDVEVQMQLVRHSDGCQSEPVKFTYIPQDTDPDRLETKRRKVPVRLDDPSVGFGQSSSVLPVMLSEMTTASEPVMPRPIAVAKHPSAKQLVTRPAASAVQQARPMASRPTQPLGTAYFSAAGPSSTSVRVKIEQSLTQPVAINQPAAAFSGRSPMLAYNLVPGANQSASKGSSPGQQALQQHLQHQRQVAPAAVMWNPGGDNYMLQSQGGNGASTDMVSQAMAASHIMTASAMQTDITIKDELPDDMAQAYLGLRDAYSTAGGGVLDDGQTMNMILDDPSQELLNDPNLAAVIGNLDSLPSGDLDELLRDPDLGLFGN